MFLAVAGFRGERHHRSSQLELVGLLGRIHCGEPCRFHYNLAAGGTGDCKGCEAEYELDLRNRGRGERCHSDPEAREKNLSVAPFKRSRENTAEMLHCAPRILSPRLTISIGHVA